MNDRALISVTDHGLYCRRGDFYIDPWRPVARAVITHAHSDHARSGSEQYFAAAEGAGILRHRLGTQLPLATKAYGEIFRLGAAQVSLHPAGHVLGSSQVRVEIDGEVWVVTGDYKRAPDPTCAPFTPVICDVLISEATFALPCYAGRRVVMSWRRSSAGGRRIAKQGIASVVFAYALGKAQRVLAELLAFTTEPVYAHGAVLPLVEEYRRAGIAMVPTLPVEKTRKADYAGALVIAPPSAAGTPWMRRFGDAATGFCSGWMRIRGARRRRGYDRGFVLSDHADWPALLQTVRDSQARKVLLTHGYSDALVRYLCEQAVNAAGAAHCVRRRSLVMRAFSQLYEELDSTTSINIKLAALVRYFRVVPAADAAWAIYFLSGRRLKRIVGSATLRHGCCRQRDCQSGCSKRRMRRSVILPKRSRCSSSARARIRRRSCVSRQWLERLLSLPSMSPEQQQSSVVQWWKELDARGCFLLNKLLTGELRVGVSPGLVERALAEVTTLPRLVIAHRLMGAWQPGPKFWSFINAPADAEGDRSRPYPFCLASPLEVEPESLGPLGDWLVEWKWDGIRAQIMRRAEGTFIWSRGEELHHGAISGNRAACDVVAARHGDRWRDPGVARWRAAVRRVAAAHRPQEAVAKVLTDTPVQFLAYDILELDGVDVRARPMHERRALLTVLDARVNSFDVSPIVAAPELAGTARAAQRVARALRRRNDGQASRLDATAPDAHVVCGGNGRSSRTRSMACSSTRSPAAGRRANLFTDYTFAVRDGDQLVPVAKAYSGLTDSEIARVDRWIRQNTVERFGPVRSVKPELVFEIAFEAINESNRHKSGVAVRFPRIARWREDKPANEANTIEDLRGLLRIGNALVES